MTDLSSLSDDDLKSLYTQANAAAAVMPALIQQESGGRPGVVGPQTPYGRAQGLTQMLPDTAQQMAGKLGLPWRPELMTAATPEAADYQRQLGEAYLREGIGKTGSVDDGLKYYHGGPNSKLWGPKTQAYAQQVGGRMDLSSLSNEQLQALYEAQAPKVASAPPAVDKAAPPPSIGDMRALADPAYAQARAAEQTRKPTASLTPGLGDWENQVFRNVGINDEMNGASAFGAQGVKNILARIQGKPVAIPAGTAGQAAMDYDREQQRAYAQAHPGLNTAATIAGIAASGVPTGAAVPVSALRAGGNAAALQAPFALARHNGTLVERLPAAAADTALAFGTGSALQAAGNALARSGAAAAARPPTDARVLANEGVQLTPGQILGGVAQRAEDAMTSIPVVGDSIRAAKIRGLEGFNRAGYNRALADIGQELPAGVNVGRDAVTTAHGMISDAYDRALSGVHVAPDAQFAADLGRVNGTAARLSQQARDAYQGVVNDVTNRFTGPVSGADFKLIDADLATAQRAAQAGSGTQPGYGPLATRLGELRTALNDTLTRTNPAAAAEKASADAAFAKLIRLRDASESLGARGGVFTAPQLQRAVRGADKSPWGFAEGNALMQDLSEPASRVLPPTVPDSGTPFRSLMTTLGGLGGAVAGGSALGAAPLTTPAALGVGGTMLGGAALYSRPVMAAINALYRTMTPGAVRGATGQLSTLVAQNPAAVSGLLPVEADVIQRALSRRRDASGQ